MIRFHVPHQPIPKQSFQKSRTGGYTKASVKDWQNLVAQYAMVAMEGREPFTGLVSVVLRFVLPDRRRRDIDNLGKGVQDGMNGIVYEDDSQIFLKLSFIRVGKPVGVDVEVCPL